MKSLLKLIAEIFSKLTGSKTPEPTEKLQDVIKDPVQPKPEPKIEIPKEPANTSKETSLPIRGLDLSHHNNDKGPINFKKIKESGITFVYLKCTEGQNYQDPCFLGNYTAAKTAGLLVGVYHFMRPKHDPNKQLANFEKSTNKTPMDLPHCLDWEADDGVTFAEQARCAEIMLSSFEKRQRKVPVIYTGAWYFNQYKTDAYKYFSRYPLWISDYGKNRSFPRLPKIWSTWAIWQTTESGTCPGVPARCDLNVFNGTKMDFERFKI